MLFGPHDGTVAALVRELSCRSATSESHRRPRVPTASATRRRQFRSAAKVQRTSLDEKLGALTAKAFVAAQRRRSIDRSDVSGGARLRPGRRARQLLVLGGDSLFEAGTGDVARQRAARARTAGRGRVPASDDKHLASIEATLAVPRCRRRRTSPPRSHASVRQGSGLAAGRRGSVAPDASRRERGERSVQAGRREPASSARCDCASASGKRRPADRAAGRRLRAVYSRSKGCGSSSRWAPARARSTTSRSRCG